jgi:hypothetical protein
LFLFFFFFFFLSVGREGRDGCFFLTRVYATQAFVEVVERQILRFFFWLGYISVSCALPTALLVIYLI